MQYTLFVSDHGHCYGSMRLMTQYSGNDIYCDLIIPKLIEIEVVYEDKQCIAIKHTKPYWPVHIVVTPKQHVDSLLDVSPEVLTHLMKVVKELSAKVVADNGSCRVLTNLGEYQDSKHLHIHISSGEPLRK